MVESADDSMLAFYQKHAIAPIRQDIGDLNRHFLRRRMLYHQLGIPAAGFNSRRVLEIGPGTGQNALFIAAQYPSELVVMEPNATGREEIELCFSRFTEWRELLRIEEKSVDSYIDPTGYDLVLCEGLVGASGHQRPRSLVESIASHVKPGGILVLTCIDYTAYLSEALRRLLAFDLAGHLVELEQRTAALVPVFAPHLDSLAGASRRIDDWIIDNLINPASIGGLTSFADCVDFLSGSFDVLATSPRFIVDWEWYKSAALHEDFHNRIALESYWRNLHTFLDYRNCYPDRQVDRNQSLLEVCSTIHHQIREYEETAALGVRKQILNGLLQLRDELYPDMRPAGEAIAELCSWLAGPNLEGKAIAESRKFGSWFGRGQTYVSLVRRVEVELRGVE